MKRLLCWALALLTMGQGGHRWRLLRLNTWKNVALMHLHPMAGIDAECTRCQTRWIDADPEGTPRCWEPQGEVFVFPCDGPTS